MKRVIVSAVAVFAMSALVVAPAVMAQQPSKQAGAPTLQGKDAQTVCMDMMHGSGMTEEGKKAMQEFMKSPKAPEAMNNMMEMARRMGNGDPMLGMTKMMEMMGGMSGMMGGQASPGMQQPK